MFIGLIANTLPYHIMQGCLRWYLFFDGIFWRISPSWLPVFPASSHHIACSNIITTSVMSVTTSSSPGSVGSSSSSLLQHESYTLLSNEASLSDDGKDLIFAIISSNHFSRHTYLALKDTPAVRVQWLKETTSLPSKTLASLDGQNKKPLGEINEQEMNTLDLVREVVTVAAEDDKLTSRGKLYVIKAIELTKEERGLRGVEKVWGR